MMKRTVLCAAILAFMSTPLWAAKALSYKETLRQQAEHACYNDATTLCKDAVPDEDKITACMKLKRAQLSPECGKVFDKGI